MMSTYRIDPKSPLIFRGGRPFGAGFDAETLPFPLPSTIAGSVRTAFAESGRAAVVDYTARRNELQRLRVAGPLLVRRALDTASAEVLFPRPLDTLYLDDNGKKRLVPLGPDELADGEGCDLRQGLRPIVAATMLKGKPQPGPVFWWNTILQSWLANDRIDTDVEALGVAPLPQDRRTHVALDSATLAADAGRLFQSVGLDFGPPRQLNPSSTSMLAPQQGWHDHEFALLAHTEIQFEATIRRIGGEGRIAQLTPVDGLWPVMTETLRTALHHVSTCRLVLATPAIFANGWLPGWINEHTLSGSPPGHPDMTLTLCAAAVERWQAVSGWDLVAHQPRAVRRMVPAGAVYWFTVAFPQSVDISALWLNSISDHEQDRLDGFGLVVPGTWTDRGDITL